MTYLNLKFSQSFQQRFFTRANWTISLVVGLLLGWNLISHNILIWLLIPMIACLGWVASFGWRSAVKVISRFVNQLERL